MKPVVSMYDESGNMLRPWAEAGYTCYAFDILNKGNVEYFAGGGTITYIYADFRNPDFIETVKAIAPGIIFGFPPCTDLAVSGAKHFEAKHRKNPYVFVEAVALCKIVAEVADACGCAYAIENPKGLLSTMWRKWNHKFDPYMYGGYLPEDDVHPRWPDYIMPRDAYPKETFIWSGNGFYMPWKKAVEVAPGFSVQFKKLGGKSQKTKQIRSETPRGFAQAVFESNRRFV